MGKVKSLRTYVRSKKRKSSLLKNHRLYLIPPRIPRPHDEIRRVQRGLSERISRISLRQRTVVIAQYGWEISIVRAVELQSGYRLQATAEASAEAAFPVPPRRAHDTLQPQDESIIVGYYTSAEVPPPASFSIKIRKERIDLQWQEMTVLTVS